MTAGEVIDEIKHLAPGEQARVISFVRGLGQPSPRLTGGELTMLAEELTQTDEPAEAAALREQIAAGFYGAKSHA